MAEQEQSKRPISEHPCHGLFATAGDKLSHRHWFQNSQLMPTCERCGTPIDRQHNVVGPVSWTPETRTPTPAPDKALMPEAAVGEDQGIVVDIEKEYWRQLSEAVEQSTWIPHEHYFMNDWVSDACDFLRNGPAPVEEPENGATGEQAFPIFQSPPSTMQFEAANEPRVYWVCHSGVCKLTHPFGSVVLTQRAGGYVREGGFGEIVTDAPLPMHDAIRKAESELRAEYSVVPALAATNAGQVEAISDAAIQAMAEAIYQEVADEPLGDLTQRREAVQRDYRSAARAAIAALKANGDAS